MTRLFLIRHAENEYTVSGKLAGWIPEVHLNEAGKVQAEILSDYFKSVDIHHIYSSPLVRALETARPIAAAHDIRVVRCNSIAEVRYGKWQGKSLKVLRRQKLWDQIQRKPSICSFPDGESIMSVQNRAVEVVKEISDRHTNECVLLVSHADVIKMILAYYLGLALDLYQRLVINTASISEIMISENDVRIVSMNVTTHPVSLGGKSSSAY